jgi:ketosteroid isomerase-like protein
VVGIFLLGCAVGAIVASVVTLVMLRQFGALARPTASDAPAAAPAPPRTGSRTPGLAAPGSGPNMESDRQALERSLHAWLDATRQRDVPGQMRFYPDRVPVFYTRRDVTKDAVRDEKTKVIGRARVVDIETDPPEIVFERGGRQAIMQFRKRYTIAGPGVNRRGEVLQELRWTRTGDGWKIIGERDAAVLSSVPH